MAKTVNLDAMIPREDFSVLSGDQAPTFEQVQTISVRDFATGSFIGPRLRKPDFQRETNHWSPEQVVSLLQCFVDGELIPSVILWRSQTYLFVVDGGHRLSVLKAWVEDDYGDGPLSQAYFNYQISADQKKAAKRCRDLVNATIKSFKHFQAIVNSETALPLDKERLNNISARGVSIQWVTGNAERAETSFFRINTQGAPLDDIEESLLRYRHKPIAIAARAIIRAGSGHKYWSAFGKEQASKVEELAHYLHSVLFDPEYQAPIKTLDLPIGGPKSLRIALQILMEFLAIANRGKNNEIAKIDSIPDDLNGEVTVAWLKRAQSLARRICGNDGGSLGLHPAVYFYGPTGRHSSPLFMGTVNLVANKLANNDKEFFVKFTKARSQLEKCLVENKDLIATILQRQLSRKRSDTYTKVLEGLIASSLEGKSPKVQDIVEMAEMSGKLIVGAEEQSGQKITDDTKSQLFIESALSKALTCPICEGFLDPTKSVSYDHIKRVSEGGNGELSNVQMTHPYCNQSIKN